MKSLPAVLALALLGCASTSGKDLSGPIVGVALDTPDHFMVARSGVGKHEEPKDDGVCRNPMVDPRDRTALILRRSAGGKGDYAMDPDALGGRKYGMTSQQFLRIDCATGKPIGLVAQ